MEIINSSIGSLIVGGLGGGVVYIILYRVLREWLSERLRSAIKHEYDQKLETHKAQLTADMQVVLHERQLHRLRTSLFFDHQRAAFASLLSQIAQTSRRWGKEGYDPETGFVGSVPHGEYNKLQTLFYDHQLFLDRDCIVVVQMALDAMSDSFPIDQGNGEQHHRDVYEPFQRLEFLRDRIAAVFQEKIGLDVPAKAKTEIALLGAIRLVNWYHIAEIGLPVKGALKLDRRDNASDAVMKAARAPSRTRHEAG